MRYRVKAVPREGHDGRNRAGRRFFVAHWTELGEAELTPEIRDDPLLIVEPILQPQRGPGDGPTAELSAATDEELIQELAGRGFAVTPGTSDSPETGEGEPARTPEGEKPEEDATSLTPVRCTGLTKAGEQCRRDARPGSDPPRCPQHEDAPEGGQPEGSADTGAEKAGEPAS